MNNEEYIIRNHVECKPTKEIGKRNGIVERFFESTGTIINKAKIHKHQTMKEQGITGKQYRRMMKQNRKGT